MSQQGLLRIACVLPGFRTRPAGNLVAVVQAREPAQLMRAFSEILVSPPAVEILTQARGPVTRYPAASGWFR